MRKVPAESSVVFRAGVIVTRVGQRRKFDKLSRTFGAQEVDPESGVDVWSVDGYDIAAMMAPPIVTKAGATFRESAEVRISVVSAEEPVIPDNQVNGMRGVAQFDGLMLVPWMDRKKCDDVRHNEDGEKECGCRVKIAFRAQGMRPFRA